MQTILLIEDQPEFQKLISALFKQKYRVILASSVREAIGVVSSAEKFDLVLLDVELPDGDGFQLFSKLKNLEELREIPIIFLTGKSQVNDRVAAFSLGAEDYIVKPFEPLEFRARIESKLTAQLRKKGSRLNIARGRLRLDKESFRATTVESNGTENELALTPHEFRLLAHFLTHEGHILSRDQLMSAVWGDEVNVLERTVDRHISALRRKLDSKFEEIQSIPGIGYRFSIVNLSKTVRVA